MTAGLRAGANRLLLPLLLLMVAALDAGREGSAGVIVTVPFRWLRCCR